MAAPSSSSTTSTLTALEQATQKHTIELAQRGVWLQTRSEEHRALFTDLQHTITHQSLLLSQQEQELAEVKEMHNELRKNVQVLRAKARSQQRALWVLYGLATALIVIIGIRRGR